jgi:hypothetical protein
MPADIAKIVRALAANGYLLGLQVFINGYGIIVLVQVVPHTKTYLLQQVVHIQHLHARCIKYFFTTLDHLFGAMVIDKS